MLLKNPSRRICEMVESELNELNKNLVSQMCELQTHTTNTRATEVAQWVVYALSATAASMIIAAVATWFANAGTVFPADVLADNKELHQKVDRLETLLEIKPADVMRETRILQGKVDELADKIEQLRTEQ